MKKALLIIGGPKNGTVLHITDSIKDSAAVVVEHEGNRYEYRQSIFKFEGWVREHSREPYCRAFEVFIHGELPADNEIIKMIQENDISPMFG